MKAENTKITCEREHQMKAAEHLSVQQNIIAVSRDISKTLKRARYEFIVCILFHWVHSCMDC